MGRRVYRAKIVVYCIFIAGASTFGSGPQGSRAFLVNPEAGHLHINVHRQVCDGKHPPPLSNLHDNAIYRFENEVGA
jgi:hypothetical protein